MHEKSSNNVRHEQTFENFQGSSRKERIAPLVMKALQEQGLCQQDTALYE